MVATDLNRLGKLTILLTAWSGSATAAASPCPSWSGFNAVGDTWEYDLSLFLFSGWERWEIIELDADTGDVTVEVTGERVSDGPIFTYTRLDRWRCDEDGLWNLGWLMDLRLTDAFGVYDEVADTDNEWQMPQLFLPAEPLEGDEWEHEISLDTSASNGRHKEDRGYGEFTLRVGATTTDTVLGSSMDVLPIYRTDFGSYSGEVASYTSYYAEDIGLVRRDDLVLIDYTPAR